MVAASYPSATAHRSLLPGISDDVTESRGVECVGSTVAPHFANRVSKPRTGPPPYPASPKLGPTTTLPLHSIGSPPRKISLDDGFYSRGSEAFGAFTLPHAVRQPDPAGRLRLGPSGPRE